MKGLPQNRGQRSDEELMLAYQNGDSESFEILYERHSARVFAFVRSKLRDPAAADDAFQATFLKLHQARSRYDASLPFAPWLFTVCRSVIVDALRAKHRVDLREELNPVAVEEAVAPSSDASSTSVPDLGYLPENQRRALELRYGEDLSFEEMATRLETSAANSRKLVSRAIAALRKTVQKEEQR